MKLLFINVPTYTMTISKEQSHWNKIKRIGAEKIYLEQSGIRYEEKKSLCRGLWIIASEVKKLNHEVRWVDIPPNLPEISSKVFYWADQIWLYSMTPTFNYNIKIVNKAKKINKDLKIFIGGPHVRFLVEEILTNYKNIDFVEHSQSDPSAIVNYINNPNKMPGIAYIKNNKIIKNPPIVKSKYTEEIDTTVLPLSLDSYHINTSSSRGCARDCLFCLDGKIRYIQRDLIDFKKELHCFDNLIKKNSVIHLFDSSIWTNSNRGIVISEFIKNNLKNNLYSCDLDNRTINSNILRELHNARVRAISVGFESCNNDILNHISKNGTFEERVSLAKSIRKEMPATSIKAYWLLGLPGSTRKSLKRELEGIQYILEENIVDLVSAKYFVPYPGTEYFDHPSKYDLSLVKNFNKFDRYYSPPICFPKSVGQSFLKDILLDCEKLVASCYLSKLHISPKKNLFYGEQPNRYNGHLYISREELI